MKKYLYKEPWEGRGILWSANAQLSEALYTGIPAQIIEFLSSLAVNQQAGFVAACVFLSLAERSSITNFPNLCKNEAWQLHLNME